MTRVRSAAFNEHDEPAAFDEGLEPRHPWWRLPAEPKRERLAEILNETTAEYPFVPGLPSWLEPT